MYLTTRHGFFSVVAHKSDPDQILIRAKAEEHLERLREVCAMPHLAILPYPGSVYPWRIIVDRAEWLNIAEALAGDIDYTEVLQTLIDGGAY